MSKRAAPMPMTLAGLARASARSVVRGLNRVLAPLEIRILNLAQAVPDLRGVVHQPSQVPFHTARPALLDVPLRCCRTLLANLPLDGSHPFVATLRAYARDECRGYFSSPLKRFYDAWQPRTVADLLGIDRSRASSRFLHAEPSHATPPWSALCPDAHHRMAVQATVADNRAAGHRLPYEHGVCNHGPVTDHKGRLEFERLVWIHDRIRDRGYHRSNHDDGDICGTILLRGRESRVLIHRGQHRAAAVAALGYERIPIRLTPIPICRNKVTRWPNVENGLYQIEEALAIFDLIFEGVVPDHCHWPDTATSKTSGEGTAAIQATRLHPPDAHRAVITEAPP
jgi:hypothetical protein